MSLLRPRGASPAPARETGAPARGDRRRAPVRARRPAEASRPTPRPPRRTEPAPGAGVRRAAHPPRAAAPCAATPARDGRRRDVPGGGAVPASGAGGSGWRGGPGALGVAAVLGLGVGTWSAVASTSTRSEATRERAGGRRAGGGRDPVLRLHLARRRREGRRALHDARRTARSTPTPSTSWCAPNAAKVKAKVQAEVKASGVSHADADRVNVLLYVNQTTTSTANGGQPQVALNRVMLSMVRSRTAPGWSTTSRRY